MRPQDVVQTMPRKALLALFVAQILMPPYDISVEYGACLFWERICADNSAPCPNIHCEIDDVGNVIWPQDDTVTLPPREEIP